MVTKRKQEAATVITSHKKDRTLELSLEIQNDNDKRVNPVGRYHN
jgi:hypothetical protein